MSKEGYFEMCEALGSEPDPDEVPIDLTDLSTDTLEAMECYGLLSENWSGTGMYLGKNFADLYYIAKLNKVPESSMEYVISICSYIDKIVSDDIAKKHKQAMNKAKNG